MATNKLCERCGKTGGPRALVGVPSMLTSFRLLRRLFAQIFLRVGLALKSDDDVGRDGKTRDHRLVLSSRFAG
ncbi:hypothetical protein NL676_000807 [Syzygium grande]|nr:hypothetical protein NL676_000807 [Syzygium grande]